MAIKHKDLDKFFNEYSGTKASVEERYVTRGTINLIQPMCENKNVLHLGLGNGFVAKCLESTVRSQTIIEGSLEGIKNFSFESSKTNIVHSFFEKYHSDDSFDMILASHVLEHVDNPIKTIIHIKSFMKEKGLIFFTVPNANSMHRNIGVEMGILTNKYELNESDIKIGHQRVYDLQMLFNDLKKADLNVEDYGGYNLKLVSLFQMKDWSQDLLDAIFNVSRSMPADICANLWVICSKN